MMDDVFAPPPHLGRELNISMELAIPPEHVCMVGSTMICGAGNDEDFLCLVASESQVERHGYSADTELTYESPLRSFRKGNVNIIATTDRAFFSAEIAIAHGARLLHIGGFDMGTRDGRIAFHSQVRAEVLRRVFP